MSKYQIGEIIKLGEETTLEGAFGTKRTYKTGTEIQFTANNSIVYPDGAFQMLSKEHWEEDGYDTGGITIRILRYLKKHLPIKEIEEDYDISDKEIIDAIEDALYDIFQEGK